MSLRDFLLKSAPQALPRWYERLAQACLAPLHQVVVQQLQDLPRGAHVLDDGCGSGGLVRALAARRPDLVIVATDVSDHLLMLAEDRAREEGVADAIRFECVKPDAGCAPGGPFDVVVSTFTLYCQQDHPARALERWYRSLHAGGTCLVMEAVRGDSPSGDFWAEDLLAVELQAHKLAPRWLPMGLLVPAIREIRGRQAGAADLKRLIQDSPFGTSSAQRLLDARLGAWRVARGVRLLTLRSAEVVSTPEEV